MGLGSFLGGLFGTRTTTPVTKPAGSDGVYAPGGYLVGGERNAKLQGRNKYTAYANAYANMVAVAAMARTWGALHQGAKWVVEPNKRGGRKAERMADLVREGLVDAQMETPWSQVVAKAGFCSKFDGASIHEQILRRRADGKWITDRFEVRPLHTVDRWDKEDERSPWRGVWQQTDSGGAYYVQRERMLYVADMLLGNSPDGVGIGRHLTRLAEQIERLEQLEGQGFEFSLHGVPVGEAPFKDLFQEGMQAVNATSVNDPRVKAWVDAQVAFLDNFLKKHSKDPSLSIMFDSETYRTGDEKRAPSDVRKWGMRLLQLAASGQLEVRAAINAKGREALRLLCMEWLAMGDGEGARAVHDGKTTMFGMIVDGSLESIGHAATNGPARRLVVMNGGDPDTCAPRVYPEPVPSETIAEQCRALQLIAQAGAPLKPEDIEIVNAILERMRLPAMKEVDPASMLLPRMGPDGMPVKPGVGEPLDPAKGEVDVELEDDEQPAAKPAKKGRRR